MTFFARAILLSTLVIATSAAAQVNPALRPYTACKFDDGLLAVEASQLPAAIQGRTVETLTGPRQVPILRGEHITFSYPSTSFFATVKVEQIPPDTFTQGKADLISNFDHILAGDDDSARNMSFALRPLLHGFEVYGMDRKKLEGNTLGIYLLIDNRTHIVASIFFFNQEPQLRKFSTLAEYATLRDRFLDAYTSCVHGAFATPTAKRKSTARRHR